MVPFVVTDNSINLTVKGKMYVCQKSHANFEAIKKALKSEEIGEDDLLNLVDIKKGVETFSFGKIKIEKDVLIYNGRELHNCLATRIVAMVGEGYNVAPLVKFLDNLMENPSARAVNEFYGFLERNKLPMTDDGCFLAYKKVRHDYLDIHSHTMDNSVGQVVEMPRNAVDDEKERTCSYGLHFASFDYMPHYSSNDIDDHLVIVKINPRDVVAFPADYNGAKGRCCRYEVVDEIKNDKVTEIKNYFVSAKDYGHALGVLKTVKEMLKDFPNAKYNSNLADLGLNNFAIRKLVADVCAKYNVGVEFNLDSPESVCIDDLVNFVLNETPVPVKD